MFITQTYMHICSDIPITQTEIYKEDFIEERKDRDRARGAFDDLQKKKGGENLKEVAALQKDLDDLRKEYS